MVWVDVAVGKHHACALNDEEEVYCWGNNTWGELGNSAIPMIHPPVQVQGGVRLVDVAVGESHSCGISGLRQVFCWGRGGWGQLGDGSRVPQPTPVLAAGIPAIRHIALGDTTTFAEAENGTLYCWGVGCFSAGPVDRPVVLAGLPPLAGTSAGPRHACALRGDGAAVCWGRAAYGALGSSPAGYDPDADHVAVPHAYGFRAVAAGTHHGCAIEAPGTRVVAGIMVCWGDNRFGQLGIGQVDPPGSPAGRPPTDVNDAAMAFSAVAAGGLVTCGLTGALDAWCWGHNRFGQLGDGTTATRAVPTRVAGGLKLRALSVGGATESPTGGFHQTVCGIT